MKAFRMNSETFKKMHEDLFETYGEEVDNGWTFKENCYCKVCKEQRRVNGIIRMFNQIDNGWEKRINFITFVRVFLNEFTKVPGLMPDDIIGLTLVALRGREVTDEAAALATFEELPIVPPSD